MLEIHSLQAFKSLASAYSTTRALLCFLYTKDLKALACLACEIKNSAHTAQSFFWRRHPDLNRGIKVLQTLALPLGYSAISLPVKRKDSADCWSGKRDSNPRHSPWQGDALPLSYSRIHHPHCFLLVEVIGFEPMTLCL